MALPIPNDIALFLIATLAGAVISGIAGFAFGLIASAIWLHAITPAQSAVLVAAFGIVVQGFALWRSPHAPSLSRLWPFLIGGAVGIPLGAGILKWASPSSMRAFVGVGLVLFSAYNLARPRLPRLPGGAIADGAVGVINGFLGGSTGLGAIAVIVWSTLRGWTKDEQRAVFQPVAIAIFAMTLAWFGLNGLVTLETVRLFALGLPIVLLGTWIGLRFYRRLDEATFRVIILALLLVSGLALLPSILNAD